MSVRLGALGALAIFLAGCGGGQQSAELRRLNSQVSLLNERVGMLERSSYGASDTSASTSVDVAATPLPETPSAEVTGKPETSQIQQALKNAGFYQGDVDGKMGPKTREAVREFQRVNGLKVDGMVGQQTWAKLSTYLDSTGAPIATEAASTAVK